MAEETIDQTDSYIAERRNLLDVQNLRKYFPITRGFLKRVIGHVRAVDDVSFTIQQGRRWAWWARAAAARRRPHAASCAPWTPAAARFSTARRTDRSSTSAQSAKAPCVSCGKDMQMIFQDPFTSLNPRMSLLDIVGEPLLVHGERSLRTRSERVAELLRLVGLRPEYMRRFPHAFSGGERQRIGIARALALNPRLVVADEPVSALDVSVQAQVINLLSDLQEQLNLTYLFVAHDLSVVRHISDRVAVMYVGKMVELAETEELFSNPKHPYTSALLQSVPIPDPKIRKETFVLEGEVASPANPPSGCYFHPRCAFKVEICTEETPEFVGRQP